ncbi:beta-galactosidase [Fimbriimonas ginsengisoli]|uniref:Beta-galactosidase n=1 Tax=Fimbriimonas ginsengisoli Gsoil 348 TaxID=661478 RepID=A0A068NKQ1_FIMGI|nr:beta-galactosidase [Fimbriimonas ginsengisoli]AIE84153.1 Beta-galactosidase [Fimbriimonas ginsengisoli Gsoil 348]
MRFVPVALAGLLTASAVAQPKFLHPDRVRYDGQCFTIDGKDTFLFSGAFHYFRCPKALWRDRFRAIKEAGFNAVETYVAWNWSERKPPVETGDFSQINLRDLDEWLTMAEKEFGLYTIVRPGPYICAEWATGGFPNWLSQFRPAQVSPSTMWFRGDDPFFMDWSRHWMEAVAKVVNKHQQFRQPMGGHGVILWQVENEYDFAGQPESAKRNYVRDLIKVSQKNGIEVPIFGCWTRIIRDPKGDPILSQAFDNPNQYPRTNIEAVRGALEDQHLAQPWAPKMVTEFQGGWFGQVGGLAAEEQGGIDDRQINALTLYAIENGLTALNYYMLFGGTNLGDWAAEGITTSYDYNAPIREWGGTGPKYRAVQAIGKMLEKYGADLARSEEAPAPTGTPPANLKVAARLGRSGAHYLFVRNVSRTEAVSGTVLGTVECHLEPFGMNVFRYTTDPSKGEWLVQPVGVPRVAMPPAIPIRTAEAAIAEPAGWKVASDGSTTEKLGVYDSRFLFFRTEAKGAGKVLFLRTAGGELVSSDPNQPRGLRGGLVWERPSADMRFVFFNPGWPNGGSAMELPHGLVGASLLDEAPSGATISDWRGRIISGPEDRSLVSSAVDTSGWTRGLAPELFASHTTSILRTTVDIGGKVDSNAILHTDGVDDEGWFFVNGHLVGELHTYDVPADFAVGQYLHPGKNDIALIIRNNDGPGGLSGPLSIEAPFPKGREVKVMWTDRTNVGRYTSYDLGPSAGILRNEHPKIEGPRPNGPLQVRSRIRFARPKGEGVAWEIALHAGGDGFLTLNGQPLGRFWEVGPQRGFYLPPSMLRDENVLELSVIPGRLGDRITAAELRPLPMKE